MDVAHKQIWQVAAGDTDRQYVDLCLAWNVILNGPGSAGPWPECVEPLRREWELSPRKLTDLRRFAETVTDGDLVVLRMGTTDVFGVGIVVGQYLWHEEFGDIDGWDLQHLRRVHWLWKYDQQPQRFPTYTLKLGDTLQSMDSALVRDWIAGLTMESPSAPPVLRELPASSGDIDVQAISEYLFDHGVASRATQELVDEMGELVRIAKWYQRTGVPSEAETIAYLVVPLLRALGWTPQKMAIEWRSVDVALFNRLPRADEHLTGVVEVKQKDRACFTARSQAQFYAEQPGRDRCRHLVVTDGVRYGVYRREEGTFVNHPHAYLNLTAMRAHYPVLECHGATEAFLTMSADWVTGRSL